MKTIEERVSAGASWLDEKIPNWATMIDTDNIHMHSPCWCIIGQIASYGTDYVCGMFSEFTAKHSLYESDLQDLGFDALHHTGNEFLTLERAWIREITKRREPVTA